MRPKARGSATIRGCTPATGSRRPRKRSPAAAPSWSPVDSNPIDEIWTDRPEAVEGAARRPARRNMPASRAAEKRTEIGDWLAKQHADAAVLSALDSIAWAFNIRGAGRRPIRRSRSAYALVNADGTADLFVASREDRRPTCASISATASASTSAREFESALAELKGKTVVVDPERAVAAIFDALEKAGAKIVPMRDPTILPKALKNPAEIAGQKAAQARDGAAIARFLHWIDEEAPKGERRRAERVRPARSASPREPRASRPVVRQHFRRRAERRDRPLQVEREDQPQAREGHALSDRFGRPICRRHHRHHPHRADRRADRRDARPLHARAQGPYRDRHRGLPQGHARQPARQLRPPAAVGSRASITPTAPATASAASSRSTRGRSAFRPSEARRAAATSRFRPA